jgi:hypothetical protein
MTIMAKPLDSKEIVANQVLVIEPVIHNPIYVVSGGFPESIGRAAVNDDENDPRKVLV